MLCIFYGMANIQATSTRTWIFLNEWKRIVIKNGSIIDAEML